MVGYATVTRVTPYPFDKANIYKSEGKKIMSNNFLFHPNADSNDWSDLTIIGTNKAVTTKENTKSKECRRQYIKAYFKRHATPIEST